METNQNTPEDEPGYKKTVIIDGCKYDYWCTNLWRNEKVTAEVKKYSFESEEEPIRLGIRALAISWPTATRPVAKVELWVDGSKGEKA